jgi:PRC-barrel domain
MITISQVSTRRDVPEAGRGYPPDPTAIGGGVSQIDIDTALGWRGKTVRDRDGEEIGTLGDIYLDPRNDLPAWGGVRTGLFGRRESIVPLTAAQETEGDLRLPYPAQHVKDAPNVDPDVAPTAEEEELLFRHYGADTPGSGQDEPDREERADPGDRDAPEVVRSEEEVSVRPGPARPVERVRLRKVRVTENVTQAVPRRREVVRLETEPPPEGPVESVEELPAAEESDGTEDTPR